MPVWRLNVLKDGKPDITRDIVAPDAQHGDIIDLLRLMAARGLTPAEILDAVWSESVGGVSALTVQLRNSGTTLSCGGQRCHVVARQLSSVLET